MAQGSVFHALHIREATALIVALYTIVLLAGAVCMSPGEAAWNGWLAALRSPTSVALWSLLAIGF